MIIMVVGVDMPEMVDAVFSASSSNSAARIESLTAVLEVKVQDEMEVLPLPAI